MYKFLRPLLFQFDAEIIHETTKNFATQLQNNYLVRKALCHLYQFEHPALSQTLWNIKFDNPVGLAAGFDKNAEMYPLFESLGFGFVEMGTVTSSPQPGNSKPRLFRLKADKGIINRMGFNSEGAEIIREKISKFQNRKMKCGINIGKNKIVENKNATKNYLDAFQLLLPLFDMCIINVSSPNTPELRKLQEKKILTEIFQQLNEYKNKDQHTKDIPLLIKISPELNDHQLFDIITVVKEQGLSGIVATNTTTERSLLHSKEKGESGGLSGLPLKKKSTKIIRFLSRQSEKTIPIIGVGGVFTATDAYEKIQAGASLIELYTGMIYEGPGIAKKINMGLVQLLKRDGFHSITQAIGTKNNSLYL